jgi:DNA-binding transcriptional ArsR family regulator
VAVDAVGLARSVTPEEVGREVRVAEIPPADRRGDEGGDDPDRVLLSGSTGGASAAATAASATATTVTRGLGQLLVSSAVDAAHRVHVTFSDWFGRLLGAAGSAKWAGDEPLEHDTRSALYDHLRAEPGTYLSGLAERLGRDPSTVSHHLSRLADDGLVRRERDGRAVVTRLAPGVEAILTQGPGDADSGSVSGPGSTAPEATRGGRRPRCRSAAGAADD